METLIAFIWGMITVFYIGMVVVVVQMRKSVKELESQIRDTNEGIQDVYRQLEQKEKSLIDYSDNLHNKSENDMNEIYRYIDSRFDKFENKITNKKEILKG
jgi:DNA anti-recombination protein RmuC